jgi:hydrogenase expression/formation protein HypC
MCLAIPGQIVEILPGHGDLALVDFNGVRRNVNIGLLEGDEVAPGDWVLIHVGFAMAKLDGAEAQATLALLEELGQAYADELKALGESRLD